MSHETIALIVQCSSFRERERNDHYTYVCVCVCVYINFYSWYFIYSQICLQNFVAK